MLQINRYSELVQAPSFDSYDVCVSICLAVVIVAVMWVMIFLWFSCPASSVKPIERPLQIGASTHTLDS
jgi:phosphate/sulfate permease